MFLGVIFTIVGAFFLFQTLQPSHPSDFRIDPMQEAAPILALVFLPIGVIFTIVGFYFNRIIGNRDKLIAQGLAGQATVVEAAETGMYVNERPMVKLTLNVMLPGRPPYTIEHREVVPLIALGMITPGSTLPVAVDPVDPHKLAIDWSGETQARAMKPTAGNYGVPASAPGGMPMPNTLSAMGTSAAPNTLQPLAPGSPAPMGNLSTTTLDLSALYGQMALAGIAFTPGTAGGQAQSVIISATGGGDAYQAQLAALRTSGATARAVIKSVDDLGVVIQGEKVERFELEVTADGGTAYPVQHSGFVPASAEARAVAGSSVIVHIDRTNPQNVVIDWAAG